jgi:peptidoglycan hydrolase-like protein with peptidoglycan-binding domain/Tfp pilus assembly protein PilF
MSRSKWAWMETCEPVSVVACGAGERARPEARFGRGSVVGAVSSTKRLVSLMAAGVLLMGVAPAGAVAGSVSGSHAASPTKHSSQHSSRVPHAGVVMLALGSGYSTVNGDAGVRALQRRLADAGFALGPIDGRYGPRTERAVSAFQAASGLGVDGIAGPLTLAALGKRSTVLYPGMGYARHGSGRVRALQRRLADAGYAPGPIDGRYGPRTEQAVRRFQIAHGLGVDGIAGPRTVADLGTPPLGRHHHAARSPRLTGSRHRANRRPQRPRARPHTVHRQPRRAPAPRNAAPVRQPRRARAPRKVAPVGHATGVPSLGLLALLLALVVAVGLWATRIVRRRRGQRSAGVDRAGDGAAGASAARTVGLRRPATHPVPGHPSLTTTPDRATVPIPDLAASDEAERAFREALMLEQRRDHSGALAAYRHADRLGHGAAACNLGALLGQRGELAAAEAAFSRAAERGDGDGAFNLAVLHEERGDLTGALAGYERADGLGHGAGACNLGVLLGERGDLAAAEAAFRRAAERGDADGALNLGVLLEGQGDRHGALAAYEHAERIGDPAATADMARAAARELRRQVAGPIPARKGGGHDGR